MIEEPESADIEGITQNAPKFFPEPPTTLLLFEGKSFSYTFGEPFDADGDKVSVKFNLKSAAGFVSIVDEQTLTINEGVS